MLKNISPNIEIGQIDQTIEKGKMQKAISLQTINRLECPITLNPQTATFTDIEIHAYLRQRLSQSTIDKHLRYARYMEKHDMPVDFRNPTIENFLRHLDYREQIEYPPASSNALHHEWKAMKMFLRAYGITPWDIKLPPTARSRVQIIPLPEIVQKFWHYKYSKHRYERKLYQYMFFHSFLLGLRMPSEITILKTEDIIFNPNGTAILTITEPKKRYSQRTIVLPQIIATDPLHKSLKNWLDSWRPRVENQYSDDYLFIQPNGKPFTTRYMGKKLSQQGKRVWKHYHPYISRHWSCIARLIEQKINTGTFDCYPVKNWHGHETITSTEQYIKHAEQYYNIASYNWLKRVLKFPKLEKEQNTLIPKNRQTAKKPTFRVEPLLLEGMGPKRFTPANRRKKNGLKKSYFSEKKRYLNRRKKVHKENPFLPRAFQPLIKLSRSFFLSTKTTGTGQVQDPFISLNSLVVIFFICTPEMPVVIVGTVTVHKLICKYYPTPLLFLISAYFLLSHLQNPSLCTADMPTKIYPTKQDRRMLL